MSNQPLISIIINNYNYALFLPAAIDSALGQAYSNFEVLVVDDGSTDHSRDIINSYGSRVEPIFKSNGGQSSAFNVGFENAKGEIIIFLDSDDLLYPNCLEQVAQSFRNNPDIVCTRWYLDNIDQNEISLDSTNPAKGLNIPVGDLSAEILQNGWRFVTPPTSGNAFLRSCLNEFFPIPKNLIRCADIFLFANSAVRGELAFIDKRLGAYRHNLLSSTHHLLNRKKVYSEILAADLTDRSLVSFYQGHPGYGQANRNRWTYVGDELLRKILIRFSGKNNLSSELYQPISFTKFFQTHSVKKNIKYLVGAIFFSLAWSEEIAFWGAGVLLNKHNLVGKKKISI